MEQTQKSTKGLAVITGASSGIGYELAKVFAEEGYPLLVAADGQDIYEAADVFRQSGVEVEAVQADLATFDGVEELGNRIKAATTPLECVVLNAGVGVSGTVLDVDLMEQINLIRLNVESTVHLTKLALPELVANGRGQILFTSSIAAEMPGPYYAVYAASKSFVQSFSEALAHELKDTGITVTALQPGATETNFFARAGMEDTKVGQAKKDDPAKVARQGFEAMQKGKDHIVAGSFMNKVQAVIAKFMTDSQNAKMHAGETKPKSQKDSATVRQ